MIGPCFTVIDLIGLFVVSELHGPITKQLKLIDTQARAEHEQMMVDRYAILLKGQYLHLRYNPRDFTRADVSDKGGGHVVGSTVVVELPKCSKP